MAKGALVKVEVTGMPELQSAFKALGATDAPFLAEAMEQVGQDLRGNVAARAPGSMGGKTSFVGVSGKGASVKAKVRVKHPGAAVREFGRGAVTIKPRRARAIAWTGASHPVAVARQGPRTPRPFAGIKHGDLAVGSTLQEGAGIIGAAVEKEYARLTS